MLYAYGTADIYNLDLVKGGHESGQVGVVLHVVAVKVEHNTCAGTLALGSALEEPPDKATVNAALALGVAVVAAVVTAAGDVGEQGSAGTEHGCNAAAAAGRDDLWRAVGELGARGKVECEGVVTLVLESGLEVPGERRSLLANRVGVGEVVPIVSVETTELTSRGPSTLFP